MQLLPLAHAGRRPALASISTNIAAEPINPFSFTAQRQKKSMADAALERRRAQQQQQPSVRFLLDEPQDVRRQEGAAEAAPVLAGEEENLLPAACDDAAGAATPCTLLPASLSRAAVATGGKGAGSSSPSPYVLFRGRLSFAAGEADSGGLAVHSPDPALLPSATTRWQFLQLNVVCKCHLLASRLLNNPACCGAQRWCSPSPSMP